MKIYISGTLEGPRDLSAARAIYKKAAEVITTAGHEPYLPHKKTDPESAAHLEAKAVFHADLIEIDSIGFCVKISRMNLRIVRTIPSFLCISPNMHWEALYGTVLSGKENAP